MKKPIVISNKGQSGQSLAEFGLALGIILVIVVVVAYGLYAFSTIFVPWFITIVAAAQAGSQVAIAITCGGPVGLIVLGLLYILAIRGLAVARERNRLLDEQIGKRTNAF